MQCAQLAESVNFSDYSPKKDIEKQSLLEATEYRPSASKRSEFSQDNTLSNVCIFKVLQINVVVSARGVYGRHRLRLSSLV